METPPPPQHQEHAPGGHQVVVVEDLDEGLDLGPLGDLLLAHAGGHLAGVAVDAGDQGVTVGAVSGAVVDVLRTPEVRGHLEGQVLGSGPTWTVRRNQP